MIEIKSLQGQALLSLSDGKILNSNAQTIGETDGKKLLDLAGQVLAEVEDGSIFRKKEEVLLRVEGSRVVNISGQHIATVESGSVDERALLAAAYLLFLQCP
jgi:predicted ATP-dependent protease